MQVRYTNTALKELKKLPAKDRDALMAKLDIYAETGAGDVKKLQGRDGYRLRHRTWRAIFIIQGDVVVVHIAHRSKIY